MSNPFFRFFDAHRPFIGSDSSKWPMDWKEIRWKTYPRCPAFSLPAAKSIPPISLTDALVLRKSDRSFKGACLATQEISSLLYNSCGLIKPQTNLNKSRRSYPSGGGLYPLEIYPLIIKGSEELKAGIYHYNVLEHKLEKISDYSIKKILSAFHYTWVKDAAIVFIFSFVETRTKPKYGNFAYKIGLIEAGHISQNMYLISAALNLKCSALGGFASNILNEALRLYSPQETPFYSIAIGK